jgi:hypothetical protein
MNYISHCQIDQIKFMLIPNTFLMRFSESNIIIDFVILNFKSSF